MKSEEQYKHLFGPVPSRRLGLSLGGFFVIISAFTVVVATLSIIN